MQMAKVGVWEDVAPGVRRRIHAPGKALMMMEVHFETGAVGADHTHPHEQLSYCLKGRIEFQIEGVKTVIVAGETIPIPSGASHGVVALEPTALLDAFTPLREDLLK
jgi:quercetin dioxygenase-like cupin family protein